MTGKATNYSVTLGVLAAGGLAYGTLQSLVLPALPVLQRSLHTSSTTIAWVLTAYLLSASVATPILGRVGDMVGKRKTLVGVLVVLGVGSLVSALSSTAGLMIVGRVIQGAGGAVFPLAFGIVRDEAPPERVAGGIGLMSTIIGIGGGAGIVLAGPIVEHLSYHWLFWFPLGLTALAIVATVVLVPESPVRRPGRIPVSGAALMTCWLVTLLVGVSEGPSWGWADARVLGLFVATAAVFPLWILAELRAKVPMIDMRMMRLPAVWTTNATALLLGVAMFATFVIIPPMVQTPTRIGYGFGATITQSGLFVLPTSVAMLLLGPVTGWLTRRWGSKRLLATGSLSAAAGFTFLTVAHSRPWDIYVGASLLGIGIGLGFSSMTNLIVEAVPADQTGVATGMNTNIRSVGGAIGSAVVSSIIAGTLLADGFPREQGYTAAFAVCAVALGVAFLASLAVPRRSGRSSGPALGQSSGQGPEAAPAVGAARSLDGP